MQISQIYNSTSGFTKVGSSQIIDFTNFTDANGDSFVFEKLIGIWQKSTNKRFFNSADNQPYGSISGSQITITDTAFNSVTASDIIVDYQADEVGIDRVNNKIIIGGARNKSRDNFSTKDTTKWDFTENPSDLFGNDGDSVSYYRITKGLVKNTKSFFVSKDSIQFPIQLNFALSISQRISGQEIALELVGVDGNNDIDNETTPADISIVAGTISVTSNVWTINTQTAHGLKVNSRIVIFDSEDSRLNILTYVTAINSPTQFTVTSTLGNGSYTVGSNGKVRRVNGFDFAKNGAGFLFENTTATQATIQVRQGSRLTLPAIAQTVGTTVATPATPPAFSEQFVPASTYEIYPTINEIMFRTIGVDSISAIPTNFKRTQNIPTPDFKYKIRVRAYNLPNLTVPIAKIISIAKTGTTTATVTTDVSHGLTINSFVQIYGVRDITNFPNLTAQTQVASVPTTTTFTIIIGTASTNTSTNSGIVALVNGGGLLPAINFNIQSASRTSNLVTFVMSGTVTGVLVGEMFEVAGCDLNVSGETFNGQYKILSVSTTNIVVEKTGADFTTVNCGGAFIKLTDVRIHGIRNMEHTRTPVEVYGGKTAQDENNSVPVKVVGTSTVTASNLSTNIAQQGGQTLPAHSAATTTQAPLLMGGRVLNTSDTTLANLDSSFVGITAQQQVLTVDGGLPDLSWTYTPPVGGISNSTTGVTIKTAAGASLRNYIKKGELSWDSLTNATEFVLRDGASGTVIWRFKIPAGRADFFPIDFDNLTRSTANTLLEIATLTASGTGSVYFTARGYTAP